MNLLPPQLNHQPQTRALAVSNAKLFLLHRTPDLGLVSRAKLVSDPVSNNICVCSRRRVESGWSVCITRSLRTTFSPIAQSSRECVVASHSYQIDPSVYPSAADDISRLGAGVTSTEPIDLLRVEYVATTAAHGITSRAAGRMQNRSQRLSPRILPGLLTRKVSA